MQAAQQVAEVLLLVRADLGDVRVEARLPAAVAGAARRTRSAARPGFGSPSDSASRPLEPRLAAHVLQVAAHALEVERGTGDQEDGRRGLVHGSEGSLGVWQRRGGRCSWRGMVAEGPDVSHSPRRSPQRRRDARRTHRQRQRAGGPARRRPHVPPPPEFTAQANASDPAIYEQADSRLRGLVGELGPRARVGGALGAGARLEPALGQVVRRRQDQRLLQLPRPPRRGRERRPRRLPLGGRGRRAAHDHLLRPARDDEPVRERARRTWASSATTASRSTCRWSPRRPAAMLACARIGAPHSVVFGGFSAQAAADRINDCEAKVLVTADFSLRRGKPIPMKENVDAILPDCPSIEHCVVVRRTGGDVPWTEGRDVWWHEACEKASARLPGRRLRLRADAVPALHVGHHREAEGHPAHDRRLHDRRHGHAPPGVRHQARDRRLLVLGRHRLGHRPQLHRLRAARERLHVDPLRGRAGLPGQGPLVGDRRALQGDHLLHGADRDPGLHQVGPRVPGAPRPLLAAAARDRSASRSTRARGSGTTR